MPDITISVKRNGLPKNDQMAESIARGKASIILKETEQLGRLKSLFYLDSRNIWFVSFEVTSS